MARFRIVHLRTNGGRQAERLAMPFM
jgi:hypothetical protein